MLCVIDLYLLLFNTYRGIYSIPKESKSTALPPSINDENQCVPLLFLSLTFIVYALFLILGKFFLEKNAVESRLIVKTIIIVDIVTEQNQEPKDPTD